MTHNAEEAEKDIGIAQEPERIHIITNDRFSLSHCLDIMSFFVNRSAGKQQRRDDAYRHVYREQHTPAHAEVRYCMRSTPHGNIRSHQRGYRLDELPEGER